MNITQGGPVMLDAHNHGEQQHPKLFVNVICTGVSHDTYTSITNGENGRWLEDANELDVYVGANSKAITQTVGVIYDFIAPKLGTRRHPNRANEMVKKALVNLYIAYRNGIPMRYSRNRNHYTHDKRYGMIYYKFPLVPDVFDAMEANGFIRQIKGFRKDANFGRQTRAWATEKLLQLFIGWEQAEMIVITRDEPEEVIKLKDKKKVEKGYTDNSSTNQARLNVKMYNEFIKQQLITLDIQADTEISFRNLESIQRNSNNGYVNIDKLYQHNKIYEQQDNNKIIYTTNNNINPSLYTITNTVQNDSNSVIRIDINSVFANKLTFSDNYVFSDDVRGTTISDISYTTNMMYKTNSKDKKLKKALKMKLDMLRKRLKQKWTLKDFGIGGISLTSQYNTLHRVFNNDSFEEGGRFYGAYHIGLGKTIRPHIRLNGQPTVELDYKALHIRMLYHIENIDYVDDPYNALCEYDDERNIYKKLLLISINAETENSLVKAFRDEAWEDGLKCKITNKAILSNLNKFKEHHHKIAGYLGTGIGLTLQNKDSQIAEAVLIRLTHNDIPCLPIHDSFIVPAQYEGLLCQAMFEEYEKVMGFMPLIEKVQ